MFSHGILTGALFLMVGFFYERTHTRQIADMSSLAKPLPIAGRLPPVLRLRLAGPARAERLRRRVPQPPRRLRVLALAGGGRRPRRDPRRRLPALDVPAHDVQRPRRRRGQAVLRPQGPQRPRDRLAGRRSSCSSSGWACTRSTFLEFLHVPVQVDPRPRHCRRCTTRARASARSGAARRLHQGAVLDGRQQHRLRDPARRRRRRRRARGLPRRPVPRAQGRAGLDRRRRPALAAPPWPSASGASGPRGSPSGASSPAASTSAAARPWSASPAWSATTSTRCTRRAVRAIGVLTILLSDAYLARRQAARGEFYGLLLLVVTGMIGMAISTDIIAFFVSFELMSLPTYILAGYIWRDETLGEASLKYFVTGAFSSAILAFGLALLYGATGADHLRAASPPASPACRPTASPPTASWSSPSCSSSPASASRSRRCRSTAGRRTSTRARPRRSRPSWPSASRPAPSSASPSSSSSPPAPTGRDWGHIMIILAILTMVVGNVLALPQRNLKRMLAYSSIAHAGYLTLGLIAAGKSGDTARRQRDPVLPGRLRAHEPRRLRRAHLDPQPPRTYDYSLEEIAGLGRTMPWPAILHGAVHGLAHRHPADSRLLGQVLPVHGRHPGAPHVARRHRRAS